MKADEEVTSKNSRKCAEIGPDWSKLAEIVQKWPKFDLTRAIKSCSSN